MTTLREQLEAKIERDAVKWCVKNQFATHKYRGVSYKDCGESFIKLVVKLDEALFQYENEFIPKNRAKEARKELKRWVAE